MDDEIRIVPIDINAGKYVIEISKNSNIDPHEVARDIDEWLDGDGPFLILYPGIKLTRVDTDDIQEET